ncbi:MAG: sulfotransferase domain-containing protein [Desulfobacteraceae bacterium]|nr:sulfotransferase domain-containing protein [Desulfobacteraceae bacterium]
MPTDIQFAIIANPRTGTNHFIDLLNSHPDISCHREVFHRDTVYLLDGTHDDLLMKRNKNPLAFLKELFASSATKACGFKIFMDHDDSVLDAVLRDPKIKKIVLYRPNLLAVHSSAQIAVAEQRWIDVIDHPVATLDKLAFVHIPKTAGLSLHAVLEEHFGKASSIRFGNQEDRARFFELSSDALKKFDYITGHLSMKELHGKEVDFPAVAVVRDPLNRLVSMLQYYRKSNLSDHQSLKFDEVKKFAAHMQKTGQYNMQCWHLGGTHKFGDAVEMIHRKCLYVAPLEYYDDFLRTISELIGTQLKSIQRNVTPKDDSIQFKDKDYSLLEPLIGDDLKLVKYIKQNYKEIKENFIKKARLFSNNEHAACKYNFGKTKTKVTFNPIEFKKRILSYKKHYKYAIDLLNETNQDYLFVTYEDYNNESFFRRVFPFLMLGQPDLVQTRMKKMNSSDILSRYENPKEVRAYLQETDSLHWAHEGFMQWP